MAEPTILLLSTSDTDLISARSSGKNYRWANPSRLSDEELPDLLTDASIVVVRDRDMTRSPVGGMRATAPSTTSSTTGGVAPSSPQILAKTDVNGDGKLDLIVLNVNSQATQTVTLLRGDGKGGFQKPTTMLSLPAIAHAQAVRHPRASGTRCSRRP